VPRTPRQTHGRRTLAAAAAAGLLVSLFAPWYRETVVTRGLTGLRMLTLTRSGWQAFSFTELVIAAAAVLALLVMIGMRRDAAQVGTPGGVRLSGIVVAALGAVAFVVVLTRLATASGTSRHALDDLVVATRWGIFLALACSAALVVTGLRLIRVPKPATERPHRRPARQRRSAGASAGGEWPTRGADPESPSRQRGSDRPRRGRSTAPRPDGRVPSRAPAARRSEQPRPPRRADGSRRDDQPTSWLDLPDS